jgi:hypothetical protein
MTRSERVIAGFCLGAFACLGAAPPAHAGGPGGAQFFFDPIQFEQTMADIGKVAKAQWDFKPDNLPPGAIVPADDFLDINSHPVNAPGVWLDAAGNDLWPPDVDNVQFSSNQTPGQGPLTPVGISGLFYAKAGFQQLDNNMRGSNFPEPSFDIISGPPAGDNHTAIAFDLLSWSFGGPAGAFQVTVFNKNEQVIGAITLTAEPFQKLFLGILAPPGDTIGRVDIWDTIGGFEGISYLALYQQQQGQPPWCPGDCAFPPDKVVNIVDFLSLIAQWGFPGSCDLDGNGIVNIQDFLLLLALWGPCPAPGNDECVDKEIIDRFDPAGETIVPFDMWGATPSPDPYQCIPLDPQFKDIWYCLRNVTDTKKLVTILGTLDLFVEVYDGCICPPGPLVTCGVMISGLPAFPLQPGQEVCIRLINDLNLPNDALKGDLIIRNEPIQVDPVNFYTDPALFFEAVFAAGKIEKLFWDFKPYVTPPGTVVPLFPPLDIFTHFNNPNDPWPKPGMWPPFVDNVQFWTNITPKGPLTPDGPLLFVTPGGLPDIDNNALLVEDPLAAMTILSGPPSPDDNNHTAMAFELVATSTAPPGLPATYQVTVFDKNELIMGELVVTGLPGQKIFVGVITKDPAVTIARVDIHEVSGLVEGISAIWAFNRFDPNFCVNDCGTGNVDEGEACAGDEYVDVINGGCNSTPPVFGAAQCGDTVCGQGSTFVLDGASSRDTDWFLVDLPDPDGDGVEELRARLSSEFNGVCFIVDGISTCTPVVVGTTGSAIACDPTGDAFACLPAPGTYAVFVATANFTGSPCADGLNDYTVEISCNPCPPGAAPSTAFDAETSARMLAPASP